MEMDLTQLMGQAMGGATGSATMRIEFFDYGEDVTIEVPDASEVTPFSDVMGGFGGAR
jgi:hypothetical protein